MLFGHAWHALLNKEPKPVLQNLVSNKVGVRVRVRVRVRE